MLKMLSIPLFFPARLRLSAESFPLIITYQIPSISVQRTPSLGENVVRFPTFSRRLSQTVSLRRNGSLSRLESDETVKAPKMLARLSS